MQLSAEQNKYIHDQLVKKTEGNLFIHKHFQVLNSEKALYCVHYYVVRDSIVYSIGRKKPAGLGVKPEEVDNTLTEKPSGDDLMSIVTQCENIGVYDESKIVFYNYPWIMLKDFEKKYMSKLKG